MFEVDDKVIANQDYENFVRTGDIFIVKSVEHAVCGDTDYDLLTLANMQGIMIVEQVCAYRFSKYEEPLVKVAEKPLLKIEYMGMTFTIDPNKEESKKFAEMIVNTVYDEE